VFSLADTARLLRIRGDAMQKAVPVGVGGMAAVLGLSFKDVGALVDACNDADHYCVAANDNSDGQVVLSGHIQAIEKAVEIAAEFGAKRCLKLPVSAPFHSPLMQPAAEAMAHAFMEIEAHNAEIPIVANVLAKPETEKCEIIKNLIEQVTGTVRWRETMAFFSENGVTDLVELGAGKVLSGMAKRSLKEVNSISVYSISDIEELAKNL
jgi:[acyl-carrier-protein] S-malonyltransferase